jgi:hypothetical protein
MNSSVEITHFINKHEKDVLKEAFPNATYKQVEEIIKLNINPFLLSYYTGEKLNSIMDEKKKEKKIFKFNFIPNKIYFCIGRVWIKNEEGNYEKNSGEIVYLCPSGEFSYNGIIKCKLIIPGKEVVNNIYVNKKTKSSNSNNKSNITLFEDYKFEKNPNCYYYREVNKHEVLALNSNLTSETANNILKKININELLELLFAIDYNNQFIIDNNET